MDSSCAEHASDSVVGTDNDDEELIPVAVPVGSVTSRPDDVDSEDFDTVDGDEETSLATDVTPPPPSSKKRSISEACDSCMPSSIVDSEEKKKCNDGHPRQSAAKGLTIPFRTIKRIMKSDPDIGIIQNDAAIVVTAALECFVKDFSVKSFEIAKRKGRYFIKYDDVAEARAADRTLSFLDLLIP